MRLRPHRNYRAQQPPVLRWEQPPTRRLVGWTIAFGISVAAMMAGGGVVLWMISHDTQSPSVIGVGVSLLVFGFAAASLCLGGWLLTNHNNDGIQHQAPGGRSRGRGRLTVTEKETR